MATFDTKAELRAVVEQHGGPQQFTINLLRHIGEKGEDKLSPREAAALREIRANGASGFVQKLKDTFPDEPLEDQLPGGGPTAPSFGESIKMGGRFLQDVGRGALPSEPREPIRFESLPEEVTPPGAVSPLGPLSRTGPSIPLRGAAELAANLPGDVVETARNIGGGLTTLLGMGIERPGESLSAITSPFIESPFGTTRKVAEELAVGTAGIQELGERVGREGAAGAFTGAPITSSLEALGPVAGAFIGVGQVGKLSRLKQLKQFRKIAKAAAATRRVDLGPDVVSVAAEISSKLHNRTGGSTVNMRVGNLDGAPVRSVGLFPERTVEVAGKTLKESDIGAFIEANKDILSKDTRLSVGTFFNEEKGVTELDIVATLEKRTSEFVGRAANQREIFDLETKALIETGGTGQMTDDVLRALGPEEGRLDRILANGVPDDVVSESIVKELTNQPAYNVGGRLAQEAAEHPFARFMGVDNGMIGAPAAVESMGRFNRLWENFMAASRPQLFALSRTDPAMADALSAFVSADTIGEIDSVIHFRKLRKLAGNADNEDLFYRLLNHEQGNAIRARNVQQNIDNASVTVPQLSAKELDVVDNSPALIKMQDYWRNKVVRPLEDMAPEAGIDATKFRRTERDLFASLNFVDLERGVDALGRSVKGIANKIQVTKVGGTRFAGPRGLTKRTARAAKRATGTSEAYSIDGISNIENMFIDRYRAVHQNRLIEKFKEVQVPLDDRGRLPAGARFINIQRQEIAVPEAVAKAFESVTTKAVSRLDDIEFFKAVRNAATQISLYGPADAISHFLRLTGALYSQRGIGGQFGKFGRTLANLGVSPARFAITMGEAFNVHGAAAIEDVRTLGRLGGVRANFFRGAEQLSTVGKIKSPFAKLFFELPEFQNGVLGGRGITGLETRIRVATLRILRKLKPEWDDVRIVSEINNAYGTYVRGLQPTLVRLLRDSIGFADPFAASGIALLKTQFKATFGADIAGINAETMWSSIGSAVVAPILLNAQLNDGKLPWEIPDLKPGDIRLPRDDGTARDFPFRLVGFNVARGVAATGVREASVSYYQNKGNLQDVMLAAGRSSMNVLLARIGPAQRFLGTLATGNVPFINPQTGEFFNRARKSHTQLKDNFLTALAGLMQSPEAMLGLDDRNAITPDSTWEKVRETTLEIFGLRPRRRPPEQELTGVTIRRSRFKEFQMGSEIALNLRRAMQDDPDVDIVDFITKDAARRGIVPATDEYYRVQSFALRRLRSSTRGIFRSAAEAEAINEDE